MKNTNPFSIIENLPGALKAEQEKISNVYKHLEMEGPITSEESELEIENSSDKLTVRVNGPLHPFFGISASEITDALDSVEDGQDIHVILNSPGGYLSIGQSIFSELRSLSKNHKITTEVRGIAASAAGLIFLAGDERIMSNSDTVMLHNANAAALFMGQKSELDKWVRNLSNALDNAEKILNNIFKSRTNGSEDDINTWLSEDSYFTADEAIDAGIATELIEDEAGDDDEEINNFECDPIINALVQDWISKTDLDEVAK